MNNLNQHYRALLGLNSDWSVEDVGLDLAEYQVVILLAFVGSSVCCPQAGADISVLCRHGGLSPRQCYNWKKQLLVRNEYEDFWEYSGPFRGELRSSRKGLLLSVAENSARQKCLAKTQPAQWSS